jgi:hypothetical protein
VPLQAPEAASLRRAIDLVLAGLEPNGAIACDRAWNLIKMNDAAARLFALFVDLAVAPPEVGQNVLLASIHPFGLRPSIVNFEEVAAIMLERVRREAARLEGDPATEQVRAMVASVTDLPAPRAVGKEAEGPFITVHLRRNGVEARFFTTIQTIGTPIDATAEDVRIETYFPADEATRDLIHRLAKSTD